MASEKFQTLDEIFANPAYDDLLKLPKQDKPKAKYLDPEIEKFKEIVAWVEENGREPEKTPSMSTERTLFSRLKGIRTDENRREALKPFDTVGVLNSTSFEESKSMEDAEREELVKSRSTSIEDALTKMDKFFGTDPLGSLPDTDGIFDTSKLKKPQRPEKIGKRVPAKEFSIYEPMFKKVQAEITNGSRKLIPFKNYEVLPHHYYVYNGVLGYIESIYGHFTRSDGRENAHMRIIYENGTEADVLTLGFAASMYGKGGKIVTDIEEDYTFIPDEENVVTGSVYVLKSLSTNPTVANMENLYKVGVTKGSVKKRIANAERESTYLYGPVEVVADAKVVNIEAHALENALHKALAEFRVDAVLQGPNSIEFTPREWFQVPFSVIEDTINKIVTKLQQ